MGILVWVDLRTYPDLGGMAGFDGLDADGTAANGDVLTFGYAFADHAFSTPGVYEGGTAFPRVLYDSSLLAVDTTAPEPASLFLLAAGIGVLFFLKKARSPAR